MTKIKNSKNTQFKKGQSGNPAGLAKVKILKGKVLDHLMGEGKNGKSNFENIISKLQDRAERGDVPAARELLDRGIGKVRQSMEVSSSGAGAGIKIEVGSNLEKKEIAGMLEKLKQKTSGPGTDTAPQNETN